MGDGGGCLPALRGLVFIFNLFFWIAGIVLLALGVWLLFDPAVSDYVSLHSENAASYRSVCWLVLLAGAVMTFIGFLGCCGAWKLNQGMLACFFVVLILVFCVELACAVLAYNKQEQLRRFVDSSMYETIREKYGTDNRYKAAFDKIQEELQCCGVRSYTDWLHSGWEGGKKTSSSGHVTSKDGQLELGIGATAARGGGVGRVPSSCCNADGREAYPTNCGYTFNQAPLNTYAHYLHPKGCSDALYDAALNHLDIIIALCVFVGAAQLIGMVFSMVLCCCVNKREKETLDGY